MWIQKIYIINRIGELLYRAVNFFKHLIRRRHVVLQALNVKMYVITCRSNFVKSVYIINIFCKTFVIIVISLKKMWILFTKIISSTRYRLASIRKVDGGASTERGFKAVHVTHIHPTTFTFRPPPAHHHCQGWLAKHHSASTHTPSTRFTRDPLAKNSCRNLSLYRIFSSCQLWVPSS